MRLPWPCFHGATSDCLAPVALVKGHSIWTRETPCFNLLWNLVVVDLTSPPQTKNTDLTALQLVINEKRSPRSEACVWYEIQHFATRSLLSLLLKSGRELAAGREKKSPHGGDLFRSRDTNTWLTACRLVSEKKLNFRERFDSSNLMVLSSDTRVVLRLFFSSL
jgi:hypothetical protein